MRNIFCIVIVCLLGLACHKKEYKNPHVLIRTRPGNIELELYADKAPKSVNAFLAIVDSGHYTNATFYRVLNDFNQPSDAFKPNLIQGGLWRTKRQIAVSLPTIPHETTKETGISHKDGVISFARNEPGTARSEFFICIGDQKGFDYGGENNPDKQGYAAFGKVVKGMDVVKTIYNRPEDDQYFEYPIFIFDIIRL